MSEVAAGREALIVSEVRFMRDSLIGILAHETEIRVCGHAATVEEALRFAARMQPAMLLLDAAFPSGTETAARLYGSFPAASIIALGVCETAEEVLAWAEAGIAGYVPNTASVDDLVTLIKQINRGEQSCPSRIAGSLLRRLAAVGRQTAQDSSASSVAPLTRREREIFQLLGAGLSNKDIARRLRISLATTKTHVHNLMAKLNLQRRTDVMLRVSLPARPSFGPGSL